MPGKYGNARSPDLISDIAIGSDPVTTDNDRLYPTLLHNRRSHIIANKRDIHPGSVQLVCRQASSLEQRAGFIGKNFKTISSLFSQ